MIRAVAATTARYRASPCLNASCVRCCSVTSLSISITVSGRPWIVVEDPMACHLDPRPVPRPPGELCMPLAVREELGFGLGLEDGHLGGKQLARERADRLLGGPAVQPGGACAPEPDSSIESSGEDGGMTQDLEQLPRLALAFLGRVGGGGLGFQPGSRRASWAWA